MKDFMKEAIKEAEERYKQVAKGGIPEDIKEVKIDGSEIGICDLLVKVGFASSKGEAKRMITGRGVKINGETIENITLVVKTVEPVIVQFGKNKFVKVIS